MSYPYGPENYPTWESYEFHVNEMRAAYYAAFERLQRETDFALEHPELAERRQRLLATMSHEQQAGMAFGEALDAVSGSVNADTDRFMQDMFNILEDKIIGKINERERDLSRRIEAGEIIPDYIFDDYARCQNYQITYSTAEDGWYKSKPYTATCTEFPDLTFKNETADKAMSAIRSEVAKRLRAMYEANDPRLAGILPATAVDYLKQHGYAVPSAPDEKETPSS